MRQERLILSLRRIHENHIVGAFQCRQNIRRIPLQNFDFILQTHALNVHTGILQHHLIAVNRGNGTLLRQIAAHQPCGKGYGCADFQNIFRLLHCQKHTQKPRHLGRHDWYLCRNRFLLNLAQNAVIHRLYAAQIGVHRIIGYIIHFSSLLIFTVRWRYMHSSPQGIHHKSCRKHGYPSPLSPQHNTDSHYPQDTALP